MGWLSELSVAILNAEASKSAKGLGLAAPTHERVLETEEVGQVAAQRAAMLAITLVTRCV